MNKEAFEKGLKTRREVLGADYVDASIRNADDFNRPLQGDCRMLRTSIRCDHETWSRTATFLLLGFVFYLSPWTAFAALPLPADDRPVLRIQGSNTIGAKLGPELVKGLFEAQGLRDMGKCISVLKERYAGQMDFAKASGMGRESLYKAFAPGAKPRFHTVLRVIHALGIDLCAQPGHASDTQVLA